MATTAPVAPNPNLLTLVIVNEVLAPKDAEVFLRLAQEWVPKCQASEAGWDPLYGDYRLVNDTGLTRDYVEKAGEAPFYLTERKAKAGDAGYHDWNDALKIPYAYCSLKNSRFTWGKFHYPLVVLAHKLGTILIPTRSFGKFSILGQGLATSFIHEAFETVGNPQLKNVSGTMVGTTLDLKGEAIFVENADPVARNLIDWKDPVTGQDIAVTNFVFRKWFNKLALGRVDFAGVCKGPFDIRIGGYLYQVLAGWTFRKVA